LKNCADLKGLNLKIDKILKLVKVEKCLKFKKFKIENYSILKNVHIKKMFRIENCPKILLSERVGTK
jgi:hypothetical protein